MNKEIINNHPASNNQGAEGAAQRLNDQIQWANTISGTYSENNEESQNQEEVGTDNHSAD
jgi:hypothetical protein